MHVYAQQLRLPNTFPNIPAIHVYFHKYGHALEMNVSGNHFAFLEPIMATIYNELDNCMQHVYTTNTTDANTPNLPIVPKLCSKINC